MQAVYADDDLMMTALAVVGSAGSDVYLADGQPLGMSSEEVEDSGVSSQAH